MDRMKSFLFMAMFAAVVVMAAGCGRNNGTANHTTEYRPLETTAVETSEETFEDTEGSTTMHNEESGGVLRDMMDDVEQGVDRMTE